ncbi:hypothetical protein J2754_002483 [Halarchaeum solikamskense]|uniref:DUF7287 family protein n=1 Tax=Halarchaeum nitratireducens TaxID=489913 RepID=UPI001B3B05C8|nr:hypothetical protein [Halarchaeum solikamskense]MBP2252142.1 hypothetical protein [Halarchaeum solikamskense]
MARNTRDRAQTTLDFTIGTSVFLVTLVLVFATAPGLLSPFAGGNVATSTVADRIANDLVQDELAAPDEPYALGGDVDARLTNATLSAPGTVSVNVTVTNASGVVASRGPSVSPNADTSVAWRVVTVDGEHAELEVRVW